MSQYRQSIMRLADSVEAGMDPTTAYNIYQNMQNEQQDMLAQKRAQNQSLIQLAVEQATAGAPYQQTSTMLQGLDPTLAPQVSASLDQLYPMTAGPQGVMSAYPAYQQRQQVSTAYQPSLEQQATEVQAQQVIDEPVTAAAMQTAAMNLVADAQKYKKSKTMEEFISIAAQNPIYQAYLAQDPEGFQKIVQTVYYTQQP